MANRQERHQRKKEMKTPRVRKKSPRGKLAKSTKISLSILAVMLLMVVAGTIFFFQKYGKEVTAAIDAGEEHAASIQESDFKQYHPTTVLDKNGQVIKELKTQERDYLTYDKMDPLVSQALIAIEDKRFYEHHGVDTQGLLTVAINAATGRGIRGASTITQQLVKNIYLTPEVSISRKIEEMVMAQSLEKKFTKHQILEYYLNNVYFGHGAYGINDFEAKIHSNALNNQLDNNEVALAVDSATKILMGQQDFRFQYQFDSKEEEDRYNEEYSSAYNKVYQRILSGGYQISTNIDTGLHDQLQGIVSNVMNAWQDRSGDNNFYTKQAAMTVIDNQTGDVVASIGGRGEEGNHYNRAFLSYRQPGSAIKPLVSYAPAYERGLLETSVVSDDRPNNTYPNNVYNSSKGNLTLRNALAISSNVVAYKLADENRNELKEAVYQPLAQMQFTGLDVADDNPIIAVGGMTYGATTQEMASGIATLVNQGNYRAPLNIQTIKRKDNGQEIFSKNDIAQQKIYSDDAAYLTIDTMKAVHENADGSGRLDPST